MYYSKAISSSLKEILYPYNQKVVVRGEPDFYGASKLIADYLGLPEAPMSFSSWSHGVHFKDLKYASQVNWNKGWVKNRLVANDRIKKFLEARSISKVIPVGLPIVYVPSQDISRCRNSVLIMLAHSLSSIKVEHNVKEFLNYAKALQKQGKYVCFCVHADCYLQNNLTQILDKNNIDWFVGSSVNDVNSLKRMRNVFEYFETVCSNVIGSHFFYAQLFGAKFFFIEPFYEYKFEQLRNDALYKNDKERLSYGINQTTKSLVNQKYSRYLTDIENAVCDKAMSEEACGMNNKLQPEKLYNLLGWGAKNSILCFFPYYSSKLKQKLKRKLSENH